MYVFLLRKLQEYITHVNTLQFIPLEDFAIEILKYSTAKFLEYIAHVNSA